MTLIVTGAQLRARAVVANGTLASLATGLRRELEPLLAGSHDVPVEKALLSRAGGRCDRDGTLLTYDPFDARHRCPRCGAEYTGVLHDRFRLYWHQLWLAERTVHGALLGVLLHDVPCRALSMELLESFVARYLDYPNRDNVLGPSRPFFSTYLESIWLLQLCVALDLLELGTPSDAVTSLGARVRERVIEPSTALIASYDEGMSNRQVWNNAALLAAGTMLGDRKTIEKAVSGESGLHAHLGEALLADGSWYEGENYHLFAHRGLWYGVQIAEANGHELPPSLEARFREGFAAPFRTLLPDLTYPSRRDSPYAVSVRQSRFAESCELGLARGNDDRLAGMLARLYAPTVPRGETGRRSSSADVERNWPATGLTRADLSWRSLLVARAELPPLLAEPLESDLLPAQGLAILRRDAGRTYVALDYGHSGGGHGHPDRLNLLLVVGEDRWFDDPGTGPYVDESLHWYRSTLAHMAPLVDGRSQPRVDGSLVAFHDDGRAGWASAAVELVPGLVARRSIVLLEDYLIDCLEWESGDAHDVALPLHGVDVVDAEGRPLPRRPAMIAGGKAKEDGFAYLRATQRITSTESVVARLRSAPTVSGRADLHGWIIAPADASWSTAMAPDVPTRPGEVLAQLVLLRAVAKRGRFLGIWSWRGAVGNVEVTDDLIAVTRADGGREEHSTTRAGWRIQHEPDASGASDVVVLGGFSNDSIRGAAGESPPDGPHRAAVTRLPAIFELGEEHYRRSEQTWLEAGQPRATVRVVRDDRGALEIRVEVAPSERIFVPIGASNIYDNEPAAINGDGVQLYVTAGDRRGGWLLMPAAESTLVHAHPIEGWDGGLDVQARWRATPGGWSLAATIPRAGEVPELALDVIVNEITPDRTRRRGQLVMSGARGEFVYLRGDRHDAERLLRFSITDA